VVEAQGGRAPRRRIPASVEVSIKLARLSVCGGGGARGALGPPSAHGRRTWPTTQDPCASVEISRELARLSGGGGGGGARGALLPPSAHGRGERGPRSGDNGAGPAGPGPRPGRGVTRASRPRPPGRPARVGRGAQSARFWRPAPRALPTGRRFWRPGAPA
jgi:hypothetical protein